MTNDSVLIRDHDKKVFKVKFLSHWSSIISEDGEETDTVKYIGGHACVSMNKGFGYIIQN